MSPQHSTNQPPFPPLPLLKDPDKDQECPVCYEILLPLSPVVLNCTHIFCTPCIKTWMSTSPTCPMCRREHGFEYFLLPQSLHPNSSTKIVRGDLNSIFEHEMAERRLAAWSGGEEEGDEYGEEESDIDMIIIPAQAQELERAISFIALQIRQNQAQVRGWRATTTAAYEEWEDDDVERKLDRLIRAAEARMWELEASHREWMEGCSDDDDDDGQDEEW